MVRYSPHILCLVPHNSQDSAMPISGRENWGLRSVCILVRIRNGKQHSCLWVMTSTVRPWDSHSYFHVDRGAQSCLSYLFVGASPLSWDFFVNLDPCNKYLSTLRERHIGILGSRNQNGVSLAFRKFDEERTFTGISAWSVCREQ